MLLAVASSSVAGSVQAIKQMYACEHWLVAQLLMARQDSEIFAEVSYGGRAARGALLELAPSIYKKTTLDTSPSCAWRHGIATLRLLPRSLAFKQ